MASTRGVIAEGGEHRHWRRPFEQSAGKAADAPEHDDAAEQAEHPAVPLPDTGSASTRISGELLKAIGSTRLVAYAMSFSAVYTLIHFFAVLGWQGLVQPAA